MRPLPRFCRAGNNVDLCRDLINLRDAPTVHLCDLAAGGRRDPVLFAVLARNPRRPALRDLGKDFLRGCLLSALFETALARLTALRSGRRSAAAFPIKAPITPPVTAPAVCFGIGGTWISSDDGGLFFFSGFGRSGINGGLLNIFDSLQRYFG